MSRFRGMPAVLVVLGVGLLVVSMEGRAYDRYSINRDATNCRACHGDFRANPYNEGIVRDPACPPTCDPATEWPSSLMFTHRDNMVNGECDDCHSSGTNFPVLTGSSAGDGDGNLTGSCAGCHGRAADGSGSGTVGFDAGLRQHHWQAGVTVCVDCHADANPDVFTPVGEQILPPNYANPGAGAPEVPDDPCNAGLSPEDKVGSPRGLDNDGDGFYDADDTDCGAVASTPGETTGVLITAHDSVGEVVSLSYVSGCGATGNKIVFGPLQDVGTYGYTGESCAIGNSGSFDLTYSSLPNSFFFLHVGDDSTAEGSYGTGVSAQERPKKTGGCWLPQDLSRRCDP